MADKPFTSLIEDPPAIEQRKDPLSTRLANFPWWGLFLAFLGVLLIFLVSTDATYRETFIFLWTGIRLTIIITLVAFVLSIIIGLITAFAQMSTGTGFFSVLARNIAAFYVQIVRGVPVIVLIFYVALVIVPAFVQGLDGTEDFTPR